jgi:hypothetical protein
MTFAGEDFGLIITLFVRRPPRRITSKQRDKRPKERQPFGTEFQVFVFFVASPLIRRGERGVRASNTNTCIFRQMS